MVEASRPPVERVRPPKAPCPVVDRVAAVHRGIIEEVGYAKAGRRMGIRINVPRTPTLSEPADAARRDGLAAIRLDLGGAR
jgi:hypothetical protein